MSRTLFWYVFKDLLRIFLLASASLAGIMSFGGLLRPLTDQGLDASQVGRVLAFLMPAMTTYSLPIAAIFATTMVYGRLSADNELTACRAAGISYMSIATPALVLGLTVSIVSLLFLCFIVPVVTLKVEKVIYSNIAQLIGNKIQRTHQIKFGPGNVFAQNATVRPLDPNNPNEQAVELEGPMIVTYEPQKKNEPRVPKDFWMARSATCYITTDPKTDNVQLLAKLDGGTSFPRKIGGGEQGFVNATTFGPIAAPSPIAENLKFMDIRQLKKLNRDLSQSKKLRVTLERFIALEQEGAMLKEIAEALKNPGQDVTLVPDVPAPGEPDPTKAERFIIARGAGAPAVQKHELLIPALPDPADRQARFTHIPSNGSTLTADATQIQVHAEADNVLKRIHIEVKLIDPILRTGSTAVSRSGFSREFYVKMPAVVAALHDLRMKDPAYFTSAPAIPADEQKAFRRDLRRLTNGVQAEMHLRASFAVSCLILVLVGCALGMMFKSGNFLTAFALSVIPALLTITLIITGQQICENTSINDALKLGLSFIWSGNAAVLVLACVLLGRLQRQ